MIRSNLSISIFSILAISLLVSACQFTEEQKEAIAQSFELASTPPPDPIDPQTNCFAERFQQPPGQVIRQLDLLIVSDTSDSFDAERIQVADGIDAFLNELSPQVETQIAVLLAHGPLSAHSGILYQNQSEPLILDTNQLTVPEVQAGLRQKLFSPDWDASTDGGEAGILSLNSLLDASSFRQAQSQGFFRSDAAWVIVFLSDENAICAEYPAGVTRVPDQLGREATALQFCQRSNPVSELVTPQGVAQKLMQLRQANGAGHLLVSGIIYSDLATMPHMGEDEFGYGYHELIQTAQGVEIDLASGNIAPGLSEVGRLATVNVQLTTQFTLGNSSVDEQSIEVFVDGALVSHQYDTNNARVQLAMEVAGGAESFVDISYCSSTTCTGLSCGSIGI